MYIIATDTLSINIIKPKIPSDPFAFVFMNGDIHIHRSLREGLKYLLILNKRSQAYPFGISDYKIADDINIFLSDYFLDKK